MLKKRIIGVIPICNNQVVQSFGFRKTLPLGKPKIFVENLDRWFVDEIVVIDFSATRNNKGPNFELIKELGQITKNTPVAYGGGIRDVNDAVKIINLGFERIILDNLYLNNPNNIIKISENIGSQAIILSLPVQIKKNIIQHFNYLEKNNINLDINKLNNFKNFFSEILLIDYNNEGTDGKFNIKLIKKFLQFTKDIPILPFGGISKSNQIKKLLSFRRVQAVCIGNSLNYKEIAVQNHKEYLINKNVKNLRPPQYIKNIM